MNHRTHPLVDVELAENLGSVQKVLVVEDPSICQQSILIKE